MPYDYEIEYEACCPDGHTAARWRATSNGVREWTCEDCDRGAPPEPVIVPVTEWDLRSQLARLRRWVA